MVGVAGGKAARDDGGGGAGCGEERRGLCNISHEDLI